VRRKEIYDERRAATAVTVTSARRTVRPGALWGLVFGGMIAATMAAYKTTFPTAASRANLVRSFQGNPSGLRPPAPESRHLA
jgi:hypothetical protein